MTAVLMTRRDNPVSTRTRASPTLLHFTRRRKRQEIETIYERNQEWLLGKGGAQRCLRLSYFQCQSWTNRRLLSPDRPPLQCVISALVVADTNRLVYTRAEYLAIADFTRLCRAKYGTF